MGDISSTGSVPQGAGACPAHLLEAQKSSSWIYTVAILLFITNIGMGFIIWWLNTTLTKRDKAIQEKKKSTSRDLTFEAEQPNMLSKKQVEEIVKKINDSVDIWGIPEWVEEKIIREYVTKVNSKMYPAMRHFF